MMNFLFEYGLFLAKAVTIAIVILVVIPSIMMSFRKSKPQERNKIEVRNLNKHYRKLKKSLYYETLPRAIYKKTLKTEKKIKKSEQKKEKQKVKNDEEQKRKKLFVLDFKGDIQASGVSALRHEITSVLMNASDNDGVVLRLESAGGTVNTYGLAASQLMRLKDEGVSLTIIVDKVAASGGYLMASVADKIIAAPFAVVGSIGVASQFPNFHKLLKKFDVDYEQITAGEYKRTLTMFGENTEKGREKFIEQIEETHTLFKDFLVQQRPALDIDNIANGQFWYGTQALPLKLVDELKTSDDFLLAASADSDIFEVAYKERESLRDRLTAEFEHTLTRLMHFVLEKISK